MFWRQAVLDRADDAAEASDERVAQDVVHLDLSHDESSTVDPIEPGGRSSASLEREVEPYPHVVTVRARNMLVAPLDRRVNRTAAAELLEQLSPGYLWMLDRVHARSERLERRKKLRVKTCMVHALPIHLRSDGRATMPHPSAQKIRPRSATPAL
jgi:hypothetical protein